MNPSEPAAPWTTAKGTGEGQGQLPQEQSGGCRPLGWSWWHTKPPTVPTTVAGADVPPQQLGQARHHPRLPGLTWWHVEQLKSASSVGKAGAQLSDPPHSSIRCIFSGFSA